MNMKIEALSKDVLDKAEKLGNILAMMEKNNKLLKLIAELVESDSGFESDSVLLDVVNGRFVTERERRLGELVGRIYQIVHPLFSDCQHKDWEKETEVLLKEL